MAVTPTVTIDPLPAAKTVASAASSVCSGTGTNITVASSVTGTSYQLRNNATDANIGDPVVGVDGTTINLPTGNLTEATTFNVLATLGSCTLEMSVTPEVTVNALPAAPEAIRDGATNVCVNAETPEFEDETDGEWSIVNGTGSASIVSTGVVTGLTAGTVNVRYTTAANGEGCTNFATKELTVDPLPTVDAIGGGQTQVCLNVETAAFTDATEGGIWSIVTGTGTASITLVGVVTGLTTGTVTVKYTVISGTTGCVNTVTKALTVDPLPTPSFTAQPGATAAKNTDVTYSTQSGNDSYVWDYSGSLTTDYTITSGGSNTNSVTMKWVTSGSKSVTINYTTNGCTAASATSSTATTVLAVGDAYQGGIVAYIFVGGTTPDPGYMFEETHGLIAAISDNASTTWGCMGTLTSATGTALGTGNQNTIKIIAACATGGIAARLCDALVVGEYSDWYLPSKDELLKLYDNRVAIGNFDTTSTGLYWSSTEDPQSSDNWNSFYYTFSDGSVNAKAKNESYLSRAIRKF